MRRCWSAHRPLSQPESKLFNLRRVGSRWPAPVAAVVRPPLEHVLAFSRLNAIYDEIREQTHAPTSPRKFCETVLDKLNLAVQVTQADLERIPTEGPLVVMANHPFGGIEGLILANLLLSVRQDVKVLANYLLGTIPDIHPVCIFVDPFNGPEAYSRNVRALKQAMRWVRDGGALGVFPAPEVARLDLARRRIADPQWSEHMASLARRNSASVTPVYLTGANGPLFQMAGLIHPRLRTALLPRQVVNKRHRTVRVHVGTEIPARRLTEFDNDRQAIDYLRLRTYALRGRPRRLRPQRKGRRGLRRLPRFRKTMDVPSIAPAPPIDELAGEIQALPDETRLATTGDLSVYLADASQMNRLMVEVGRQRERTFRAVGEGSGNPLDLDRFDETYLHLLVWNDEQRELVGAYRMGRCDEIIRREGRKGLYLFSLFNFSDRLFERLGPTVELGRSFVRPEYQKSFSPLMLLWKGIGAFAAANPQYRRFFGPVSISNDYSPASRAMIVSFMNDPARRSPLASMIQPRTPFSLKRAAKSDVLTMGRALRDAEELGDVVGDIERDGKGVPILLRQYLKLGAKSLGFNVDPEFGYCLDCLVLVDLLHTDRRTLRKYMGSKQVEAFLGAHETPGTLQSGPNDDRPPSESQPATTKGSSPNV